MKLFELISEYKSIDRVAPYYHWTDFPSAEKIIKNNVLARTTYDHPNWTPSNPSAKLIKGWFSVSRDSHYRKGTVGFVLDQEKIRQRYKVKQHASSFVAKHARGGELSQREKRWESEEIIDGPLKPLDQYLLEILITREEYKKQNENLSWIAKDMIPDIMLVLEHPKLKIISK